jgi:hypothetical protein
MRQQARQEGWSPTQKMLYTSLVPLLALVGALVLFSLLRSQAQSAPSAQSSAVSSFRGTPLASGGRSDGDAGDSGRDAFRDCMKSMGADLGSLRSQSRFSAPPDLNKLRRAMGVCRSLLQSGAAPPPSQRAAGPPPAL